MRQRQPFDSLRDEVSGLCVRVRMLSQQVPLDLRRLSLRSPDHRGTAKPVPWLVHGTGRAGSPTLGSVATDPERFAVSTGLVAKRSLGRLSLLRLEALSCSTRSRNQRLDRPKQSSPLGALSVYGGWWVPPDGKSVMVPRVASGLP